MTLCSWTMPRFIVLEHSGAPDDPVGLHYDLLLEQGPHCRAWRISELPQADGSAVTAVEIAPHRLAWLDHESGDVSGGRGFARRIDAGAYEPTSHPEATASPEAVVDIMLHGGRLTGRLLLTAQDDRWLVRLASRGMASGGGTTSTTGPAAAARDAGADWRRFDAEAIPSKESTPRLDAFVHEVSREAGGRPLMLLDVGCGNGRLSRRLFEQGFSVFGVDINAAAIRAAEQHAVAADTIGRSLRFEIADFAEDAEPRLAGGTFDVVVCQLVISIIGTIRHRANLLRHIRDRLRPGGRLFVSASGVSDAINPGYARLYAQDLPLTGERHTYLSRDARGEVLYMTHHFTPDELTGLLEAAGFAEIRVNAEKETSSRRPDEAASFLYATCRSGH